MISRKILLWPRLQVLALALLSLPAAQAQPASGDSAPLLPMTPAEFAARHGEAKRLKLKLQGAAPSEIAAAVSRQIGVEVGVSDRLKSIAGASLRFSIQADGQPLWKAIREWNRGPGTLKLARDHESRGQWKLFEGTMIGGRAVQAGPFEVLATQVDASRYRVLNFDTRFPQRPTADSLMLKLSLRADPKLQDAISALIVHIESAVDDTGRSLTAGTDADTSWQPNDVEPPRDDLRAVINFAAPAPKARSIRLLRGRLRVATVTKSVAWEIDPSATATAEKTWVEGNEEICYSFEGLTQAGSYWMARFQATRAANGPRRIFKVASPWGQSIVGSAEELMRSVRFVDAAGQSAPGLRGNGYSTPGVEKTSFRVVTPFDFGAARGEKPAKIVVDVPLEWREVQFPFEFRDLPLPPS